MQAPKREARAGIWRDQGRDVRDRKAVARNELTSIQFVIHSFETLINDRSLRLTIFRELLKPALKDRIGILEGASDWSE